MAGITGDHAAAPCCRVTVVTGDIAAGLCTAVPHCCRVQGILGRVILRSPCLVAACRSRPVVVQFAHCGDLIPYLCL